MSDSNRPVVTLVTLEISRCLDTLGRRTCKCKGFWCDFYMEGPAIRALGYPTHHKSWCKYTETPIESDSDFARVDPYCPLWAPELVGRDCD